MNNTFILHHQLGIINLGLVVCINKVYDKHNRIVCRLYYADESHWDIEEDYWDTIMEKLSL